MSCGLTMTVNTSLEQEPITSIENMTREIAANLGVQVKRVRLIDGLPIGCVDAHMLAFVHEAKSHYVLLHHDLSNASTKINEALFKIKTQM